MHGSRESSESMGPVEDNSESLDEVLAENERLLAAFLAQSATELPPPIESVRPDHRAGFVAVLGKPNVGKSTLMNAYLGERLAIVSPKPQTTRTRQLGILTRSDAQIIFVDTPGIHQPRTKLGEYMVEAATGAIPDADVIVFLVDVSELPDETDKTIARLIQEQGQASVILAMNKCDLLDSSSADIHVAAYQVLVPGAASVLLSATRGDNCDKLLQMIVEGLPYGPRYYPADQLTDTRLRDSAAEAIREQVLLMFDQEVPHAAAVVVEQFKERSKTMTYIAATIYVERESQKGILIGKQGNALKELGRRSRAELEQMLGTQVYLDLWVKVLKNWRKDEQALRRLGYRPPRQ